MEQPQSRNEGSLDTSARMQYAAPEIEVQDLRLVTNGGISGFDDSGSTSAQQTP